MGNYDDIINYNYTGPKKHPKSTNEKRAGQFAPFAALVGYDDEVKEKARITDKKFELTEELSNELNDSLNYLESIIKDKPYVLVTYFIKDNKKTGGRYEEYNGNLRRIDNINKEIEFTNKFKINIKDIVKIKY